MRGFDIAKYRSILLTGMAATVLLILVALFAGSSPVIDRFIAAIGAVGQIWIALLLLLLALEEFEFHKRAVERQSREANYERREDLRQSWRTYSRKIGYTELSEENVAGLANLLPKIRSLFGQQERDLAHNAVTAAREARDRSREVLKANGVLRKDQLYRSKIDAFNDSKKQAWFALTEKLILDD